VIWPLESSGDRLLLQLPAVGPGRFPGDDELTRAELPTVQHANHRLTTGASRGRRGRDLEVPYLLERPLAHSPRGSRRNPADRQGALESRQ